MSRQSSSFLPFARAVMTPLDVTSLLSRLRAALPILILAFEAVAVVIIIARVPYTEIDWIAYMQEVEGWVIGGSTDYLELRGDTGPLVYPAGFLWLFRFLRWAVGNGGRGSFAIAIAQALFACAYLATQAVILNLYGATVPTASVATLLILAASRRVHSLFILRLFNDGLCMLAAWVAVLAATRRAWLPATLLLSAAVSIKMNALLFAPGLVFLLVRNVGILRTFAFALSALALQVVLAAPFLLTHPASYAARAFELSRVFLHAWTVNWKFLPEDVFVGRALSSGLLAAHIATLVVFGAGRWCEHDGGLAAVLARVGLLPHALARALGADASALTGECDVAATSAHVEPPAAHAVLVPATAPASSVKASAVRRRRSVSPSRAPRAAQAVLPAAASAPVATIAGGAFVDGPAFIAYVLCVANFVGIVFARTLHYQFYTWYFHSVPLLCHFAGLPMAASLAISAGIEFAFNVGDETGAGSPLSSFILQACHFALLGALLAARAPRPRAR